MASTTSRIGLNKYAQGDDNWDHSDTVDQVDATSPIALASNGTVSASGGSTPAANTTIQNVSTNQTRGLRGVVGPNADPAFNADYAFNYDFSFAWDDTNSHWDVTITINWDTDPGNGNDVDMAWRVYEE